MSATIPHTQPLAKLDQWDDFVQGRYKEGKLKRNFVFMTRLPRLVWLSFIG